MPLVYKYYDKAIKKRWRSGVTQKELIGHINTLSKTERAQYADTLAATSSISNVMASFSRKHDVQHHVQWQRGLQF